MAIAVAVGSSMCACSLSGPGNSPSDLVGRRYVSTSVEGRAIPGGGPLELSFPARERLAASAGCNRFTGTAELSGGVVRTGVLASTRMACPPPREGADAWLRELFSASPRWSSDGDVLTLTTSFVTVTLTDRAAGR